MPKPTNLFWLLFWFFIYLLVQAIGVHVFTIWFFDIGEVSSYTTIAIWTAYIICSYKLGYHVTSFVQKP